MSEPIQSISQSNYILATQQEVSHDNTLSGNGTVDSPLGVVPGYNETVLWSGSAGVGDTITLSESPMNFERIKVLYSTHSTTVDTANTKDIGIGYTEFIPDETTTIVLETLFIYDPTTYTDANTINHGVAVYYNTQTTTWNRIISAWASHWFLGGETVRTDFNFVYVHKIVGINRKV